MFSPEQITILLQIIFIDLVLAGDNAIIIGMVASQFPPDQRKKIIFLGIGGACLLYTSPSPRDSSPSRMPSSA